jgi:hypothetical protein
MKHPPSHGGMTAGGKPLSLPIAGCAGNLRAADGCEYR